MSTATHGTNIDSILHEDRKSSNVSDVLPRQGPRQNSEEYERLYKEAVAEPEKFWGRHRRELHWFKKWDKVLEWNVPSAKWFVGGKINLSYNCLDRHLTTWRKNKAAIIWEGEPGDSACSPISNCTARSAASPTC